MDRPLRPGVSSCSRRWSGWAWPSFSGGTAGSPPGRRIRTIHDRQGWLLLAALLIVGGVVGPDSLGAAHGEFLPQRVVLLGLVALVPIFDVDLSRWSGPRRDRGAGCRRRPPVGDRLGLCTLLRPHRGPDHPRPRSGRPRPEDRHAAGFDPQPVPSQSLAPRRELAGGRYGQRRLEQLRDSALLLPRAFPARESIGPIRATWSGSRSTRTRARPETVRRAGSKFSPSTRIRSTWWWSGRATRRSTRSPRDGLIASIAGAMFRSFAAAIAITEDGRSDSIRAETDPGSAFVHLSSAS